MGELKGQLLLSCCYLEIIITKNLVISQLAVICSKAGITFIEESKKHQYHLAVRR